MSDIRGFPEFQNSNVISEPCYTAVVTLWIEDPIQG